MEKFLADESVDYLIVTHLREGGYEVEAIVEINPSISDEEILEMANNLKAILITEDKDFGELTYRLRKPNQGIILIRLSGMEAEEKVGKVRQVFENYLAELRNRFTVISKNKVRIKDQK
jgi:predicted nuclease of predicted toxin-antitoxin system